MAHDWAPDCVSSGALVGDAAEVGCNAVLNPGSILRRRLPGDADDWRYRGSSKGPLDRFYLNEKVDDCAAGRLS